MDERDNDRLRLEQLLGSLELDQLVARWRGDAVRLKERSGEAFEKLARDLGLVTQAEYDELELRVAQLEHRLRLLEERKTGI